MKSSSSLDELHLWCCMYSLACTTWSSVSVTSLIMVDETSHYVPLKTYEGH